MMVPESKVTRRTMLLGTAGGLGIALAVSSGTWAVARDAMPAEKPFDPVLADLHRRTFQWFWDVTNAKNGLTPDNFPKPNFCSIASVGFALTAYCIGVKSGYVSREAAAQRTLTTLNTFWNGPQGPQTSGVMGHKGFFYHFLHMDTGLRFEQTELSSVDTALFMLGALTAAAYFDGPSATEADIRKVAMALYARVDWTFMARDNGLISMGWHPEEGLPDHDDRHLIIRNWDRYNEGMMVYLLALGSPSHPVPDQAWASWAATIGGTWGTNYGEPHIGFSPLFGHQFSHVWYDFRGIADTYMRAKGSDYFINSRRATVAQRNYAIKNPGHFKGLSGDIWGMTACIGPGDVKAKIDGREVQFYGYSARGPQGQDQESVEDGTLAPTAGVSSIAFAPDICIPLIHNLRRTYGHDLYGQYGFFDAFNPSFPKSLKSDSGHWTKTAGWVSTDYLGLDQGPILAMLENYRSSFVWDTYCRSPLTGPLVRAALAKAGFQTVATPGAWLGTTG